MEHLVYVSSHARAVLTTNHGASSYGIPVLVIGREAFGPGDSLPSGLAAGELVRRFLFKESPGPGQWGPRTPEALRAGARFLGMTLDDKAETTANHLLR